VPLEADPEHFLPDSAKAHERYETTGEFDGLGDGLGDVLADGDTATHSSPVKVYPVLQEKSQLPAVVYSLLLGLLVQAVHTRFEVVVHAVVSVSPTPHAAVQVEH